MIAIWTAWMLMMAAQDTEVMRVRPSTESEAVREFEATCVAGLRDPARLDQAVAASKRGYGAESPAGGASWRSWNSTFGSLHYLAAATGNRVAPACDFTAFTQFSVDRDALIEQIGAMAARHAAASLTEWQDRGTTAWTWIDAQKRSVTLTLVLDRATPQQIVLSLRPLSPRSS